jgi:hypothetical protein
MINGLLILAALFLGFGTTVGCYLAMTFGVASASPDFVAQDFRITTGYKRLQSLIWLLCTMLGGFVTAAIARGAYPWVLGVLLVVMLVGTLWLNSWEARQRGLAHQILMSFAAMIGVVLGYVLATKLFQLE